MDELSVGTTESLVCYILYDSATVVVEASGFILGNSSTNHLSLVDSLCFLSALSLNHLPFHCSILCPLKSKERAGCIVLDRLGLPIVAVVVRFGGSSSWTLCLQQDHCDRLVLFDLYYLHASIASKL